MSKQSPTPGEKEEFDEHLKDPDKMDPLIDFRSDEEKEAAEDGRRAGKIIQEQQEKQSEDSDD
jgi:hypothetical protein